MPKRITIKNHLEEIQLTTQRAIIALGIMLVLICLLIARLGFLQLTKHNLYKTLSTKNWLDLNPIEPTRGLIYDRNGILLAENVPVFSLDIIPNQLKNLPETLAAISKIIPLSDIEIAQFQKELKQHRRFDEIPLKLKLSEAEVARFYENQYRFPEAIVRARLIRHYPYGGILAHVVGYVGRINAEELDIIDPANYIATKYIGKLGVEKYYEEELHGQVGYAEAENDVNGQPIRIIKQIKPQPGKNLYLTLDFNLQNAAVAALSGHRGAIAVIQPKTGQILAMVSAPTYDPNSFVVGISNKEYQYLQVSQDHPLYNRVTRASYPPGSTIKPIVALQALDEGITTLRYTINDPGWYQLPNNSHKFHDHKHGGHGIINLTRAIENSCDTYFFDLGHKMGIERLSRILNQFGFGELTGIDIGEEIPGIVPTPFWKRKFKDLPWYEGDTLNSVIGQGYMQATPIQLAAAAATLANRGKRYIPHLILYEQEAGKSPELQYTVPSEIITLKNEGAWENIISAMEGVITHGTGYHFGKNTSYRVAAKTGTAQVFSIKRRDRNEMPETQANLPEHLRDHSLFIAFAPIDNPEIAIAVIVENSSLASAIARKIIDNYLLRPENKHLTSS